MFDAYTVKKVLPRLVIGVILIQLSWFIFTGMIAVVNALAFGIEALMYAPFGGTDKILSFSGLISNLQGGGNNQIATSGLFLGLAAGGIGLGLPGIVSLALTGFAGLFIGFAVLILRQVVLLALLVVSPIALVAWILPGTEKIWKIWWESFSKLLLMFPMVVGLIAAGRVFANIASSTSAGNQATGIGSIGTIVDIFIIVLGVFGPFFLIPKTFQLAGSAFANLTGMVNDRSRGFFDRQRERRKGLVAENMSRLRAGTRFTERGREGGLINRGISRFNKITRGMGTGLKGQFGLGARGREATDQVIRNVAAEMAKNPAAQAIAEDDYALRAATYTSYAAAVRGLQQDFGMNQAAAERAARAVSTSIGFGRSQAIWAAQRLVSTGTGYENLEQMTKTLARASGGNSSTASALAGFANFESKAKGRHDLSPSYGTLNDLVHAQAGIRQPGQTGIVQAPTAEDFYNAEEKAWDSADPVTLVRDRAQALGNHLRRHVATYQQAYQDYQSAVQAGNMAEAQNAIERARRAETAIFEVEQSKMYATGENAALIDDASQVVSNLRENWLSRIIPTETGGAAGPAGPGQSVLSAARRNARLPQPRDLNRE